MHHNESRGDRMIDCETVAVTVAMIGSLRTPATIVVPAFTRDPDDFRTVTEDAMGAYLDGQRMSGGRPSTGDFAMFLMSRAAIEPHRQPVPDATEDTDGETPA